MFRKRLGKPLPYSFVKRQRVSKEQDDPVDYAEKLPAEIWRHIFGFFDKRELFYPSLVCKKFNDVIRDEEMEKNNLFAKAPWPPLDYLQGMAEDKLGYGYDSDSEEDRKREATCVTALPNFDIAYCRDGTPYLIRFDDDNSYLERLLYTREGGYSSVKKMLWHESGVLITVRGNGCIDFWDIKLLERMDGLHYRDIADIKNHCSGKLLIAYKNNCIDLLTIETKQLEEIITLELEDARISCIECLSNGDIVCGLDNGHILIIELSTKKCIKTLIGHENDINALMVLANDDIVSGCSESLRRWDGKTYQCTELVSHKDSATTALIKLSNDYFASATMMQGKIGDIVLRGEYYFHVCIWNVKANHCDNKILMYLNSEITSLSLLPNGDLVVGQKAHSPEAISVLKFPYLSAEHVAVRTKEEEKIESVFKQRVF